MSNHGFMKPVEILLVDDDPGDVELTKIALRKAKVINRVHVANDGEDGLAFLRQKGRHSGVPRPDIILLDLNMPRMNGKEFLAAVKSDTVIRGIPVVVLTTSSDEVDVLQTYDLQGASFITKPVGADQFFERIRGFDDYWLSVVRLPPEHR